jgi:hypothetical protein
MNVYLRVPGLSTYPLEKIEGVIENGQSRDTGNSGHTRHRTKTNKTQKDKTTHHRKLKRLATRDTTKKHNTEN